VDTPRTALRSLCKRLRLSTSYNVSILAAQIHDLINSLPSGVQSDMSLSVTAVSVPHLVALYMDDMSDAAKYAGNNYRLWHRYL
jgi:hypothetical protein